MSALISRIERGLICLTFPFLATIALPAGVRGPVDRCQGLFLLIASRIRCMLSKGSGAGHAVTVTPVRYASEKQLALIQGLIRKSKIPYQPLLGECKVSSFNELTVQQASRMIESLKVSGAN